MPLNIEGADAQKTSIYIPNPWYPRTEDSWICHVDTDDESKLILDATNKAIQIINPVGNIGNLYPGLASVVAEDSYGKYLNYNAGHARYVNSPLFQTSDPRNLCFAFVVHPQASINLSYPGAKWDAGTIGQRYFMYPQNFNTVRGIGVSLGSNGISLYTHKANEMVPYLTVAHSFSRPTVVMIIHRSGLSTDLYIDGVLRGSRGILAANSYRFEFYLGSIYYGTFYGKLYDFLMYHNTTQPMSEDLRLAAEGYLAHKRQINNYLPVNHIYKTTIPRLTV